MFTVTLSANQITIVGLFSLLLTWLIGLVIEKGIPWFLAVTRIQVGAKIDLGRFVKTLIVGLTAFLLAWWWYPAVLPPLPVWVMPFGNQVSQFIAWVPVFLASLSPYVGAAMYIYNVLLGYLLDPDKRKQFVLDLTKWIFPNGLPPLP